MTASRPPLEAFRYANRARDGCTIHAMRTWLFVAALATAGSAFQSQAPLPKEWIDADTGHRIVRLTDDGGGSTLYFHDNAFSPQGDTMMFNTPNGMAIVDVSKIGTRGARAEVVAPRAR